MENDTMRAVLVKTLGGGATLEFEDEMYFIIFDKEYLLSGEVEDRAPVAMMLTSDVSTAGFEKDDEVEIVNPLDSSTKTYQVRRIEPDGTGMSKVILGLAES